VVDSVAATATFVGQIWKGKEMEESATRKGDEKVGYVPDLALQG
jgi:hypothetical protein